MFMIFFFIYLGKANAMQWKLKYPHVFHFFYTLGARKHFSTLDFLNGNPFVGQGSGGNKTIDVTRLNIYCPSSQMCSSSTIKDRLVHGVDIVSMKALPANCPTTSIQIDGTSEQLVAISIDGVDVNKVAEVISKNEETFVTNLHAGDLTVSNNDESKIEVSKLVSSSLTHNLIDSIGGFIDGTCLNNVALIPVPSSTTTKIIVDHVLKIKDAYKEVGKTLYLWCSDAVAYQISAAKELFNSHNIRFVLDPNHCFKNNWSPLLPSSTGEQKFVYYVDGLRGAISFQPILDDLNFFAYSLVSDLSLTAKGSEVQSVFTCAGVMNRKVMNACYDKSALILLNPNCSDSEKEKAAALFNLGEYIDNTCNMWEALMPSGTDNMLTLERVQMYEEALEYFTTKV